MQPENYVFISKRAKWGTRKNFRMLTCDIQTSKWRFSTRSRLKPEVSPQNHSRHEVCENSKPGLFQISLLSQPMVNISHFSNKRPEFSEAGFVRMPQQSKYGTYMYMHHEIAQREMYQCTPGFVAQGCPRSFLCQPWTLARHVISWLIIGFHRFITFTSGWWFGTMEFYDLPYGNFHPSQLTFTPSFFRGESSTTNQTTVYHVIPPIYLPWSLEQTNYKPSFSIINHPAIQVQWLIQVGAQKLWPPLAAYISCRSGPENGKTIPFRPTGPDCLVEDVCTSNFNTISLQNPYSFLL